MMTGGRKCAMPFTEFAPDLCGACMASITPTIVLNQLKKLIPKYFEK